MSAEMKTPLVHLREGLNSLSAYVPKPRLRHAMDANESPFSLPAPLKEAALRHAMELGLHRYPDAKATALRAILGERLAFPADQLVLGAGSDEIISILLTAFGQGQVVFVDPSFVMYEISALTHGLTPTRVPLDADFQLDEAAMAEALAGEDVRLAFYARPNNPTGSFFDREALSRLISGAPHVLHIIDEAYAFFAQEGASQPLRAWAEIMPNVAVMSTLSKIGLAGLRVGWLCAPAPIADALEKVRQPFNLATPTQALAEIILREGWELLMRQAEEAAQARDALASALSEREAIARVFPSQGNFLLVQTRGEAAELSEALRAREIAVRRFEHPRLKQHLRISVGDAAGRDALLRALA